MRTRSHIARGAVLLAVAAMAPGIGPASAYDEAGSADTCPAANTDPENWTERSGNVHNSGDLTDWYSHWSDSNQRTITLDFSNDNVDLQVWTGNCSAPLCTSATPTWDQCTVAVTGRVKIRIVYPTPAAGVGTSNYTLRVQLPPECADGYDNDGDALADHPLDPDCTDPTDASEAGPVPPACGDRVDNDGDGRIDWPLDPGCSSSGDTSEDDAPAACGETAPGVVACLEPGAVFLSQPVGVVSAQPTTGHRVVGRVALYAFPLPTGGTVTVPCVVLTAGTATLDPCGAADGQPGSPVATLVDTTVYEQSLVPAAPLATVRVCHATLTVTVLGAGINDVPAYALC